MPNTLIRVENNKQPNGHSRAVRVYKCAAIGCEEEVRIRNDMKSHSGKCPTHSHQKRPYESIYESFLRDWRNLENTITYEEFLEFTKIENCVYCNARIQRNPYATTRGKFSSRAYYLDRKDNLKGYSVDNCVVCCTICNKIKGSHLTHEEMLVAMGAVVEYRKSWLCGNCGKCLDCLRRERA